MRMCLANVQYLFTDGKKGLSCVSKTMRNMYELYRNNHAEFEAILKEAKKLIGVNHNETIQDKKDSH